jgi:pyruvate/2-oxoglutarate/acetoin dehydrogenase E1 component
VPPLVIRAFGAEASCSQVPGLIVAAPATAGDAAGLLRAALREPEHPVLFLQDETLHESRCEVAADGVALPFGVAAVRRVGTQLTVVSYGRLVGAAFAACELVAGEDGIDAELLDLRTLQPFDLDAILESLKKTGRLLLCSVAAADSVVCEISQSVAEQGFDDLDAPIRRVRAADAAQIAQAIRGLR